MNNILQFILMLHGFAKFNEVQPNIKQWNKIIDDWENIMSVDSCQYLDNISATLAEKEMFENLIVAINNIEQIPTSSQWRNIKNIIEKTVENLKNYIYIRNSYSCTLDDELDYFYPDDLIPEAHFDYDYETSQSITRALNKNISSNNQVLLKNIDTMDVPSTISIDDKLSINIPLNEINNGIKELDNFIAASYK